MVARNIHCTVVETQAVSDPFCPQERGFRDLVPWADPYIAALMENLRSAMLEEANQSLASQEEARARESWTPRDWNYDV